MKHVRLAHQLAAEKSEPSAALTELSEAEETGMTARSAMSALV